MRPLVVGIWSHSLGDYIPVAPRGNIPCDSLASGIRRAEYFWALIHRDWSTSSNVPRADHPDMREGFAILFEGDDPENGHEYDAFEWTPGCVVDCCCCVDEDEDDGGAASERLMMAGMLHGNQGLADLAGLELDGPSDDGWDR